MQAMGYRQFVVMGPYAEFDEGVHIHIADVNLTLVVIYEIDLHFIVNRLRLVDLYDLFLLK